MNVETLNLTTDVNEWRTHSLQELEDTPNQDSDPVLGVFHGPIVDNATFLMMGPCAHIGKKLYFASSSILFSFAEAEEQLEGIPYMLYQLRYSAFGEGRLLMKFAYLSKFRFVENGALIKKN